MSEAFIYLWYDALNKMYYLGSHKGSPDDTYTHSSRVMESFTRDTKPSYMHRKILGEGTHLEMLALERKLQLNRKERCWDRYYNEGVCSGVYNGPGSGEDHHMWGKKLSPEMIKRLSESNKGKIPWNKGIKYKCEKLSGKGSASYKHGRCMGMKDNPDIKRAYSKWFGDNNREELNRKERERLAKIRENRQDWVRGPYKRKLSNSDLEKKALQRKAYHKTYMRKYRAKKKAETQG